MSSNTPRRSILRASALMASGTMVSRILGFIRNAMLIAAVGATAGGVGAAFQTANTLPNTVFNLLASGIFDAVLVPQIVGAIKRRHDGDTYVNRLLTLAGTLLFLVGITRSLRSRSARKKQASDANEASASQTDATDEAPRPDEASDTPHDTTDHETDTTKETP